MDNLSGIYARGKAQFVDQSMSKFVTLNVTYKAAKERKERQLTEQGIYCTYCTALVSVLLHK